MLRVTEYSKLLKAIRNDILEYALRKSHISNSL